MFRQLIVSLLLVAFILPANTIRTPQIFNTIGEVVNKIEESIPLRKLESTDLTQKEDEDWLNDLQAGHINYKLFNSIHNNQQYIQQ